ncbi:hypothetical protein HK096_006914, partial [Nowakowskiella sp. JEL0078]
MATELSLNSDDRLEKRLNVSYQQPQLIMKIAQNSSLLSFPSGVSPSPLPTIEQSGNRYVSSALKLEMEPNIFDHSFNISIPTPGHESSNSILNASSKVVLPFPTPSPRSTSLFDRIEGFPFSFQGSSSIGSPLRSKDDENNQSLRPSNSQNSQISNQLQFVSQASNTPLTTISTQLHPSNFQPSNGAFENPFYNPTMSNIQRIGTLTGDSLSSALLLNNDSEYSGLMPILLPVEPVRNSNQNSQNQPSSMLPMFSHQNFQNQNTGLQFIPTVAAGAVAESTIPIQHSQIISQDGRQYFPMELTNMNLIQSVGQVSNASGLQLLNAAAVAVSGQERNTVDYSSNQILPFMPNPQPAQLSYGFTSVNAPTCIYSQKGDWPSVRKKSFHSTPQNIADQNNKLEIFQTEIYQNSRNPFKRSRTVSSSSKKSGLKNSTSSNSTTGSPKSTQAVPVKISQSELLMMDDEEKRRVFLERNRQEAASKCRKKKKQQTQDLQGKVEFLTEDNENLKTQARNLADEIDEMKMFLLSKMCLE